MLFVRHSKEVQERPGKTLLFAGFINENLILSLEDIFILVILDSLNNESLFEIVRFLV